jgi:hypothetical protein
VLHSEANVLYPTVDERRKEQRFIVSGIQGYVNNVPCTILDVSASGVRFLIPDEKVTPCETYHIIFEYEVRGDIVREETMGELVRETELFFVLSYIPPRPDWEDFVRSMDFVDALSRSDLVF